MHGESGGVGEDDSDPFHGVEVFAAAKRLLSRRWADHHVAPETTLWTHGLLDMADIAHCSQCFLHRFPGLFSKGKTSSSVDMFSRSQEAHFENQWQHWGQAPLPLLFLFHDYHALGGALFPNQGQTAAGIFEHAPACCLLKRATMRHLDCPYVGCLLGLGGR